MDKYTGNHGSKTRALRLLALSVAILLSGAYCASAQPTAGRAHYGGDAPSEESEFFTPLSENDNSLRKPRRDSRFNNDCRCDVRRDERPGDRQTAWNEEGPRSQPGRIPSENDSYYRNDYNETLPSRDLSASGDFNEVGMASWYGREFDGKKTASGQIFDSRRLTAAHKTLPLGTVVMVRNMDNNKEVVVTINDRGPYVQGRILDISERGAELLDFKQRGLATVGIKIIRQGRGRSGRDLGANTTGAGEEETAFNDAGSQYTSSRSDNGMGGSEETYYNTGDSSGSTGRSAGSSERRYSDYDDSMGFAEDRTETQPRLAGRYQIQVGVFSNRFNATSFKESLQNYGHPVRVIRKGTQYAVVIEGFQSRRDAEKVNRRLRDNGYSSFLMR